MTKPTPYGKLGRPPIEAEPDPSKVRTLRLPESFFGRFMAVAKAEGLTWHTAAREALAEWVARRESKK